tara:strand:- start:668 stop:1579 length:912 start_codon:yes stop_codon:yes gene_type:complete
MAEKKILFMGYGNMTQKYLKILKKISPKLNIKFCSSRNIKDNLYNDVSSIKKFNPDLIFICSSTYKHYIDLKFINNILKNKLILVEKPIFNKVQKIKLRNRVFVAYNLRYDPALQEIKKLIQNKKIWSVEVFCNSFLPNWRKKNYIQTYSAHKKFGGGVALDLSHEIDYLLWFFKSLKIKFSINNKISDLKINSDDNLTLIGSSNNVKQIILHLNYYSKIDSRTINISSKNLNIRANLIEKKITIEKNGKLILKSWPERKFFKTYERQIKSFILNKNILSTTYADSLKVLKILDKINKISYKN